MRLDPELHSRRVREAQQPLSISDPLAVTDSCSHLEQKKKNASELEELYEMNRRLSAD